MDARKLLAVGFVGGVIALGAALQQLEEFRKPFQLDEFVGFLEDGGYFRDPPPDLLDGSLEKTLSDRVVFNQNYFATANDLRTRILVVDTAGILDSWLTPLSYKDYVNRNVYGSGVAFPCFQFMILDGSILDRPVEDFVSRMSGLPAGSLKNIPGTAKEYFLFMLIHEHAHIASFHFSLPRKTEERRQAFLKAASDAMRRQAHAEAIAAHRAALELCPADYKAIDHMAISFRRAGDLKAAEAAYTRSMRINPDNEIAARNIMMVHLLNGKPDRVIEQALRNQERFEPNGEDEYFLGRASHAKGNLKAAYGYLGDARKIYLGTDSAKALEVTLMRLSLLKNDPGLGDMKAEIPLLVTLCNKARNRAMFARYCP